MAEKDPKDIAFTVAQSLLVVSVTGISILGGLLYNQPEKSAESGKFLGFLYLSFILTIVTSFVYMISDSLNFQNWIKSCFISYAGITFLFSLFFLSLIIMPIIEKLGFIYSIFNWLVGIEPNVKFLAGGILFAFILILFFIGYFSKPLKKIEEEKFKSS